MFVKNAFLENAQKVTYDQSRTILEPPKPKPVVKAEPVFEPPKTIKPDVKPVQTSSSTDQVKKRLQATV